MIRRRSIFFFIVTMMAGSVSFLGMAHAYAVPGTAGSTAVMPPSYGNWDIGGSWQGLAAPFDNFMQSLQTIAVGNFMMPGGVAMPVSTPNFSNDAAQSAHNAFEQFDSWLAGKTGGFHIASILTIFLEIVSWLLGIVKAAVDWLLSWIR